MICEAMGCNDTATLMCHQSYLCERCGVEMAKATGHDTQPIILSSVLKTMSEEDKEFLDPLTVLVDDEEHDYRTFDLQDVGTIDHIVPTNGLTIFHEPIVMARCVHCEAYAIGHINKVGGWFARHQHYHTHAEGNDEWPMPS